MPAVNPQPSSSSIRNPQGYLGRAFLVLLFLVFAGMGLLGLIRLAPDVLHEALLYTWDKATCHVESAEIVRKEGGPGQEPYSLKLKLSYDYALTHYVSAQLGRKPLRIPKDSSAPAKALVLPIGTEHECYINPQTPTEVVLERGKDLWAIPFLLIPLSFIVIGFGGLYFAVVRNHSASTSLNTHAISGRVKQQRPWVPKAMYATCALVGVVIFFPYFINPLRTMYSSLSWQAADCTVISSELRYSEGDNDTGPTYSIEILYSYTVNGREYRADRYDARIGSSGERQSKQLVVDQHPPGAHFTCYYDPAQPSEAIILRGYSWTLVFGLVPLLFVWVGLGGVIRPRTKSIHKVFGN